MTKFAVVPVINKNFNHAIPYTYASKSYLKSVTPVIGRFKFFKCLWPYDLTQFKVNMCNHITLRKCLHLSIFHINIHSVLPTAERGLYSVENYQLKVARL